MGCVFGSCGKWRRDQHVWYSAGPLQHVRGFMVARMVFAQTLMSSLLSPGTARTIGNTPAEKKATGIGEDAEVVVDWIHGEAAIITEPKGEVEGAAAALCLVRDDSRPGHKLRIKFRIKNYKEHLWSPRTQG